MTHHKSSSLSSSSPHKAETKNKLTVPQLWCTRDGDTPAHARQHESNQKQRNWRTACLQLLWFDLVVSSTRVSDRRCTVTSTEDDPMDVNCAWMEGPSRPNKPLYSASLPRRLTLTSPTKRFYSDPSVTIPRERLPRRHDLAGLS